MTLNDLPAGVTPLGNIKGDKGDTGTLAFLDVETVNWEESPSAEMIGPPSHRGALVKLPLPMPGPELLQVRDDAFQYRNEAETFSATTVQLQDTAVSTLLGGGSQSELVLHQQMSDARQYGFIADYEGTPEYDGLDGTRVTCTDNTAAFEAMLDDAIAKGDLTVRFPAGHYGITTGNIDKDLSGCTLTLIGDGEETTIIDFVKEDATKTSYVHEVDANYIARINYATQVILKDMTLKATTNYDNVNGGQADNDAVYYGSVWGLVLNGVKELYAQNVKTTRFNYRGITITDLTAPASGARATKVELVNCKGIRNKGSGWWIMYAAELVVDGGEYAYNGQKGIVGTGYGISGSAFIDKFTVKNADFHHNYRKGFDTHGGVNGTIQNCRFEDNVLYDVALLNWAYYPGPQDIVIKDSLFSHGHSDASKAWLADAYEANRINGFHNAYRWIDVSDESREGAPRDTLKSVTLDNVLLQGAFNDVSGGNTGTPAFSVRAREATLNMQKCVLDFSGMEVGADAYRAMLWETTVRDINISDSTITWGEDSIWSGSKVGAFLVWHGSMADHSLTIDRTVFTLDNARFMAATAAGDFIQVAASSTFKRSLNDVTLKYETIPFPASSPFHFSAIQTDVNPVDFHNVVLESNTERMLFKAPKGLRPFAWTGELGGSFSFNAVAANVDMFEVVVDQSVHRYVLETVFLGERVVIRNNTVVSDATSFTLARIERDTRPNGQTRTRLIFKSKVAHPFLGEEPIRASYTTGILSWGVYEINKL